MSYQLYQESPYDNKKGSFFGSMITTLVISGILITAGGRFYNQYAMEKAEETYEETIAYYDEMIEQTSQFFKENGVLSPEDCFELYTKLLWNGYFSKNGTYTYSTSEKVDIDGNLGIQIVTGSGVCRNNEDFFCKLMNQLGYQAYQVVCTRSIKNQEIPIIEQILGNHVITIVETEEKNYYFDTTNLCTYEATDCCEAKNQETGFSVSLKPIISYIDGLHDIEEVINTFIPKETTSSYVLKERLGRNEKKKVRILRKELEPTISNICESMKNEG